MFLIKKVTIIFFLFYCIFAMPCAFGEDLKKLSLEIRKEFGVTKDLMIVNFWASWCKPCLAEFKSLKTLNQKNAEKMEILAFCTDEEETEKMMKKIKEKYSINFKFINDQKSKWADKFSVESLPNTFIFFKDELLLELNEETDFTSNSILKKIEKYLK